LKKPREGAVHALRRLGLRLTPQRLLILRAMEGRDAHLSAEDIFSQVRDRYPRMHISTVYRTLELLQSLGMVTETDLGEGRKQYHWAERGQHHHLVCSRCGQILELEPAYLRPLERAIKNHYGFRPSLHHFAIFGLCSRCLK
jgi:Fur family ferric uptake transcriptional regulator